VKEKVEFEDLVIWMYDDHFDIKHSENRIFHSFNSKFLSGYEDALIVASLFDSDGSLEDFGSDYLSNYRRLFGSRRIHLSSLFNSGFLNTSYDLSFCFDLRKILSAENSQVCDHDRLTDVLLYGNFDKVGNIFKDEDDFEFGDEVLLPELDLKSALYVLTYSESANETINNSTFLKNIKRIDISDFRKKAVELYFKH